MWPGYKVSSYAYNSGLFVVLESINKFFRRESCLDRIKDMLQNQFTHEEITEFFSERHVMTGWGTKRPYKISRVRMDLTPRKCTFAEKEGNSVSVFDYFK